MLSGKCFQAYLPSHIQLCWNNQMLSHSYLGRGWLTAANYCSICCPQQLLVWITPTGTEGAQFVWGGTLIFGVFLGRQQLGEEVLVLRCYCCQHAWLSRWPEQPGCEPVRVSPVLLGPWASQCHTAERRRWALISSCSILVQQGLNLVQWYWILVPAFFPVCCCSSKELAEGLLYHIWSVDTCSSAGLERCRSFRLEKYGSPSCLLIPLPMENLPFVFPNSGPNKIDQNNTGDTEGISCLKLGLGATHATMSCLTSEVMWVESRQGFTSRDWRFALAALQTGTPCLWWPEPPLALFSCQDNPELYFSAG